MRVRCKLRELRENLPRKDDNSRVSLRDIEQRCGVSPGILSQLERGVMLPPDRQVKQLEDAYGAPIEDWYSSRVLLELEHDPEDE